MDELKSAINRLVKELKQAGTSEGAAIRAAYDATPPYRPDSPYNYYLRDLAAFLQELTNRVQSPSLRQAIQAVRTAQKQATLYEADTYGRAASGLSIFMPMRPGTEPYGVRTEDHWRPIWEQRYRQTRFAKDTGWDEFLATQLPSR
jgi:hypothetical protein